VSITRRRFLNRLCATSAKAIVANGVCTRLALTELWGTRSAGPGLASKLANDPLRPQFHLMPAANWMNDPNGPIFYKGRYHMFFQYNPNGAFWGTMHWAHATSPDMIHWQHETVAMAPTPEGYDRDGVFSGSAVLDRGTPTMIYTGVLPPAKPEDATLRDGMHTWREVQCLAVSHNDELLTWEKRPEPIIARPPEGLKVNGFRDPCLWREGDEWMMGLGSGFDGKGAVLLYSSRDLRNWTYLHPLIEGDGPGKKAANPVDSGEMWECPDFFALGEKHVLMYATMGFVFWKVGTYKERRFHPEKEGTVDYGAYYAAKTMLDRDGKRILWGWIPERRPESEHKAAGWAGAMALPRELSIAKDGSLRIEPAKACEMLRGDWEQVGEGVETVKDTAALRVHNLAAELEIQFYAAANQEFGFALQSEKGEKFAEVAFEPGNKDRELRINRTAVPFPLLTGSVVKLRMLVDGSVIELFVNGSTAITERVYKVPSGPLRVVMQKSENLRSIKLYQMKPISRDRLTT